jgi:hypothetical protein
MFKVQDALKAIQLKLKLAQSSEAEKIFWELIDQLRKEEINNMTNNEWMIKALISRPFTVNPS